MAMPVERVATGDLKPGMYVAKLDRPWLETPFLFQGFTIKSDAEIVELRRYCTYVYVERGGSVGAASSSQRPVPELRHNGTHGGVFGRLAGWLGKTRPPAQSDPEPGEFYADTVAMKVELPEAHQVYTESSAMFADMMEQIRGGAKLDSKVLEAAVTPMIESLLRNKDAMTWLSRIKQVDDYTYGHSVSCAVYAIAFGRHLGLPRDDLKALGLGGLLLDVGKTRIPKELLAKAEELTEQELDLMREHVHFGERIVREDTAVDSRVLAMVKSHHERYDGSGYPEGLEGPDIPVFARIAGIVDFYDALITPRVYAPAISAFDAMRELHRGAGREFQSEMVEQFIQAIGVFPNGALVELSSGEVGVVIEQNRIRRLRPKLLVILDEGKRELPAPLTMDLRDYPAELGEADAVWIDRGLEVGAYGIDPSRYYL